MTPTEIERIVDKALTCYRGHREWEDIRQEALLGALIGLHRDSGRWADSTIVYHRARSAASSYLRSSRCQSPRRRKDYAPLPEIISLDDLIVETIGDSESFESALIDRIHAEQVYAAAFALMTERERMIVSRNLRGESQKEIAADLGVHASRIYQIVKQALQRYRDQYPDATA